MTDLNIRPPQVLDSYSSFTKPCLLPSPSLLDKTNLIITHRRLPASQLLTQLDTIFRRIMTEPLVVWITRKSKFKPL